MAVSRTRDVSEDGLCLDTMAWFPLGTRLSVKLVDPASGSTLEVVGDVVREAAAPAWVLGIVLITPPPEWHALVAAARRARADGRASPATARSARRTGRRLRVLVVGDDHRQRGALALYLLSGWDVLFASDLASIADAVRGLSLDAIVAELDATDPRLVPILAAARTAQPAARRIVHGAGQTGGELVHRYVERDAGLDALVAAVTADLGGAARESGH